MQVWVALALIAAAVRLYRLDHFSYWLDEILQSFFVHGSWKFLWAKLAEDAVHPPLDYVITKVFADRGGSDAVMKLPDVVWGSASVVVLGKLIERRLGAAEGVFSALFLAFAPFHVRYSQELRPYALGLFLLLFSLLGLERFLQSGSARRLAVLYLGCLATAYSLYVAALVLALACAAMLAEDSFAEEAERKRRARRFLAASPAFLVALAIGYLPWISVLRRAAATSSDSSIPPLDLAWVDRTLSFFVFASREGERLGPNAPIVAVLIAASIFLCCRRPRARFLPIWAVGGIAAVEALEHLHPHYYVTRHFLAAGVAVLPLAALPLAMLWRTGRRKELPVILAVSLLGSALWLGADVRGLASYFRDGRPDWRPLAAFLRSQHGTERIVTDSQWTQLCTAYYVFGPTWFCCGDGRAIVFVEGKLEPLAWLHEPGRNLWIVARAAPGTTPEFTRLAQRNAVERFPTAEGAIVGRLPP